MDLLVPRCRYVPKPDEQYVVVSRTDVSECVSEPTTLEHAVACTRLWQEWGYAARIEEVSGGTLQA